MHEFRPFVDLISGLKVEESRDGLFIQAIVDDRIVGRAPLTEVEDKKTFVDDFVRDCYYFLASESCTVLLRTACGCTQEVNLEHKTDSILVPICTTSAIVLSATLGEKSKHLDTREFIFRDIYDDMGFKVYEEVV